MAYLDKGKYLLCLLCISAFTAKGQTPLLENTNAIESIHNILEHIYNFEFEKARNLIDEDATGLGEHPANYLTKAMVIYWEDRPLAPETDAYISYELYLNKAIELSEPFIENEKLHVEGIFYSMCGYALLAELYSEEGTGLKVLNTAKKAYNYLKMGKDNVDQFPDFYFSTGLYNYYREKYPDIYPFYKSFMWLFARGDMEKGTDQIREAREKGIFTRIEATIYLYHIYLRYENSPENAYSYITDLINRYPGNTRFKSLYAEVLVAMGEIDRAEILANELIREEKPFHKLAGTLFTAIIKEKRDQFKEAEKYLDQAFEIEESMDKKYFHYVSMIYAARARIADGRGDYDEARNLYKMALKNDPYVPVREESLAYLDK